MRIWIPLLTLCLLAPQAWAKKTRPAIEPPAPPAVMTTGIDFDHFEGTSIVFKASEGQGAPSPIATDIQELKFHGSLRPEDGSLPYFFFSGKAQSDSQIFVFRPQKAGSQKSREKVTTFVYPGKILEPKSRELLLESRAFIGRCLRGNPGDVYIVFQKEKIDRRNRQQKSVFTAEPADDHLIEKLHERNMPRIEDTVKLVRSKHCREIEGRNRLMLAKPLDLTPRRGMDDTDDEDEEAEKSSPPASGSP